VKADRPPTCGVNPCAVKKPRFRSRGASGASLRGPRPKVDLLRRLTVHYTDEQIAGILNRQGRLSARGERFTAVKVQGLRHHRGNPAP
jgi:hypothetical protein